MDRSRRLKVVVEWMPVRQRATVLYPSIASSARASPPALAHVTTSRWIAFQGFTPGRFGQIALERGEANTEPVTTSRTTQKAAVVEREFMAGASFGEDGVRDSATVAYAHFANAGNGAALMAATR